MTTSFECVHEAVHGRRSVLPRHLDAPGPSQEEMLQILAGASAAPDQGRRLPWRFVLVPSGSRELLANAFAGALRARQPEATGEELQAAGEKAYRAPALVLVAARAGADESATREGLVSTGCALQNMMLLAQSLGFSCGLSSGRSVTSLPVRQLFGLGEDESPVCFLAVGTSLRPQRQARRPAVQEYTTVLAGAMMHA